jgi:hypothetical protein
MPQAASSLKRSLRPVAGRVRDPRGQSLVELALALPVILVLTLVALDFGRVYLGYVNLQNMARIAANFAANHPDAWGASPDADAQGWYRNQILADATATNCRLPGPDHDPAVPTPVFADQTGDGLATGLGDMVTVRLDCSFGVVTPFISMIVGDSVAVAAEAAFPVKAGVTAVAGTGSVPVGTAPNAAFKANETVTPSSLTVIGPTVDVEFRDSTTSNAQDPLGHRFSCAFASCSFLVTLRASNLAGSGLVGMTVTVIGQSDVNFTADRQSGVTPLTVTFTDASSPGGTDWRWDFGDGDTGVGTPVSHTYRSPGTYDVSLTVTYPSPTGTVTTTKAAFVTVGEGMCTVPSLDGVRFNDAQAIWSGWPNQFTGTVRRDAGAPQGNFLITAQSLVATSLASCSSDVTVNRP